MESIEKEFYNLELEHIYDKFQTDPNRGLTEQEAQNRLEELGPNEIPKVSRGFIKIYLSPLFSWLIVIYLIGGLILFIFTIFGEGNISTIAITLGIVFFNCLVAIFQQFRATKKLNALRELTAPTTKIIRDGEKKEIPTKNIVVGDLLIINQGDKIPADARIIQGTNLEVNEASLTGESEPVLKLSDGKSLDIEDEISIGMRKNMVFYGTYTTMGNGKSIVVKTGPNTEIGKLSHELELAGTSEIPIRQKMNHFGKWLGIAVMGVWAFLTILKVIININNIENIAGYLNATMDLMPINLPLMTTIVLITGVLAMAHQGVIIRNLASVDSLGRVSVVCSDKTGTLTQNQMCVQHVWSNGSVFRVTGSGYKPEGDIVLMGDQKDPVYVRHLDDFPHLKLLLIAGFLNNNSALVKNEVKVGSRSIDTWNVVGSPTEGALMVLFQKGMGEYVLDNYDVIREYPFNSTLKRMSKVFKNNGKGYSFTKGASEVLMPQCSKIIYHDKEIPLNEEMKNKVMEIVNLYANQGYRILSLCYKEFSTLPSYNDEDRDNFESDMVYLGFVTILDPPREGVKQSVEQCHNAGVDVVMITGDAPSTAQAIAKQISIIKIDNQSVVEGKDIKKIVESKDFNSIRVFARVSPEHKQDIIERYKEDNRVVAMTGDGVNDALALNLADAGIAMGITGTDVAKEASDMVISDDSFNSIVTGIRQGRGIFAKIRSIVVFFICINVFEGIVQVIISVILGLNNAYWADPDSVYYWMWIFLSLTLHTLPSLALTFDTISEDVMDEKPKDSEEILSKNTILLMTTFGILLIISMATVYFLVYNEIYPVFDENSNFGILDKEYLYSLQNIDAFGEGFELKVAKALTMLMVVLFLCETFLILQIRRPNKSLLKSIREDSNKLIYSLIALLFFLLLALMYIPGVQVFLARNKINFSLMYLTALDWLVCILISLICIGSFEFVKYVARIRGISF